MRKLIALVAITAALVACSKPADTVIPADMSKWETELAPAIKKLSEEERKELMGFIMRKQMGKAFGGEPMMPGTTIGQAIADQKAWVAAKEAKAAEAAALKAKLEAERQAAAEQLDRVVTVTLLSKEQLPHDFQARRISDTQVFRIGVENKSDKTMVGVAGELKFIDVFDKEIGGVTFRISEKIAPGKSFVWNGSRDYNQFNDSQKAVWNLEEGKYKTRFIPEAVVFEDGTKLGAIRG